MWSQIVLYAILGGLFVVGPLSGIVLWAVLQ